MAPLLAVMPKTEESIIVHQSMTQCKDLGTSLKDVIDVGHNTPLIRGDLLDGLITTWDGMGHNFVILRGEICQQVQGIVVNLRGEDVACEQSTIVDSNFVNSRYDEDRPEGHKQTQTLEQRMNTICND